MRTLLILAGLLLLAQAQAPYAVEGVARYRGYYPLGSWEGVNPTPRGEVLWDGREKASGKVCLKQAAWDSGNAERDEKARKIRVRRGRGGGDGGEAASRTGPGGA